jgi:mono/diheme cytochrome c family protein
MNKPLAKLLASSVILALASTYGCNGDDDDSSGSGGTGPRGGRGGTAGTAAKGGKAGASGKGGSSGQGGTSGAGTGGRGGVSGSGRGGTHGGTTTTEGGNAGAPEGGTGTTVGGAGGETDEAALLARGAYLVNHVAACVDCHTPRKSDGTPDTARLLGGNPTFIDIVPGDDAVGLIPSPNLTPDPTGLRDWTDAQIKNAFLNGVDDEGEPLFPIMPYAELHNMSDYDANAIVAYLRSVPAVAATIPERQTLPAPLTAPATPVPEASIPHTTLPTTNENYGNAQHGRYLAGNIGICMECHSPESASGSAIPIDTARLFAGGRVFASASLGLPVPPYPAEIMTPNLTPDATGSGTLSVEDIVRAIRTGIDEDGNRLCPPMPSGPMLPFAGITEDDARDIAIYLKSIAPIATTGITECTPPEEGGGGASGAAGNGAGGN